MSTEIATTDRDRLLAVDSDLIDLIIELKEKLDYLDTQEARERVHAVSANLIHAREILWGGAE